MKNGKKLVLEIDGKEIECSESGSMTYEKSAKKFRFHESKINNFQKLIDQIKLVSERYFDSFGEISCNIDREGTDFLDKKYTLQMSQFKLT